METTYEIPSLNAMSFILWHLSIYNEKMPKHSYRYYCSGRYMKLLGRLGRLDSWDTTFLCKICREMVSTELITFRNVLKITCINKRTMSFVIFIYSFLGKDYWIHCKHYSFFRLKSERTTSMFISIEGTVICCCSYLYKYVTI